MKLFGEKVINSFTNSSFNIITVENFSEIFFDVYEIELNGVKYPVEKISEYKGNPVVSVPVVEEDQEIMFPFVLSKGKSSIIFNVNNTEIPVDENVPEIITEEIVENKLQESKQEILEQISKAKENAKQFAIKAKKQKLQEANQEILEKKKVLNRSLEKARENLVEEFLKVSHNIKKELIDENDNRFGEISKTIDNKIVDISDRLLESLKEDFNKASDNFEKQIKHLIKEMYSSLSPRIDKEMVSIATDIVEKVSDIERNLVDKLKFKADAIHLENVEGELNAVAKSNIELNNKINKGVNKALSRVGNADKKIDELTIALSEEVESKISKVEENISNYYTEKLKMLEEKTFNITEETRKYIVNLVTESRNNLITEIRKFKDEKPIEYIVESKGKKQTINSDDLVKDFDKKINTKIDNEVTRLRKYISVYSGGGSVAMQFADGGTMNGSLNINGNLTVVGSISASQYLGISSGSDVSGLSANWENTYTTVQSNSATWVTPTLDYLPLSGGNVTGSLSGTSMTLSGNLTVDTNTLFVDSVNNRVGIGTITPSTQLSIGSSALGYLNLGRIDTGAATIYNDISGPTTSTAGSTVLNIQAGGYLGSGGSVMIAKTNSGYGIRIAEFGQLYLTGNGPQFIMTGGAATISLGGTNNTNTFASGNTGSNSATDFLFKAGGADRTAGNLFQISNNTNPVLTVNGVTGGGNIGIGTTSPSAKLHTISTTEQLRVGYDSSNYWNASTSSTGVTTLSAVGSGAKFVIANNAEFGANATIPDIVGDTSFTDDVEVLGGLAVTGQPVLSALGNNHVMTRELSDKYLIDPDYILIRDDFLGLTDAQNPFGTMSWTWSLPIGTGTIRPQGNSSGANFGVAAVVTSAAYRSTVLVRGDVSNTVGGGGFEITALQNSHTSILFRFQLTSLNCAINIGVGAYADVFRINRFIGLRYAPVSTTWTANNTVTLNEWRGPTVANGRRYYASTGGTTHATTEPVWPTTAAGTVTDGTVVWTEGGRSGNANLQLAAWTSTDQATGNYTDTGVVAATNTWYKCSLRWVSGSTWALSINGGSEVQVTSPIVGGIVGVFLFNIENTNNVANQLNMDYFNVFSRITRP